MSHQSMEEAGCVNRMARLLNLWEIRAVVLSSFVAQLVLMLLAGIRRRKASGVLRFILWLAYQLSSWVAPYALSSLSLSITMSQRQQLVAFWAMFLLHHLGGPDNISAFSVEDNVLSGREALNLVNRVAAASYVLYKHLYLGGGGGALILASIIIFAIGVFKYVERVLALWQGNLRNIRSSHKKQASRCCSDGLHKQASRCCSDSLHKQASRCCSDGLHSGSLIRRGRDHQLDDEEALLVAHDMLRFCKRAMSDSSVNTDQKSNHELDTSREIFTLRWENMCKVVEMELSLMYDILYTKAAVIHTWYGYTISIISPLAIATATALFWCYSKEGQSIEIEDVIMTYTLLIATFLLDMRWLLRALGSTWTHAFVQCSWLHHAVLCSGRWRRLRSVLVSLDLGRLLLRTPPRGRSSYRRWSGIVGQYNLLHKITEKSSVCGRAAKAIGLEYVWNEYQTSKGHKLSDDVKEAVFTRVRKVLMSTYENKDGCYSMKNITRSLGRKTTKRRQIKLKKFRLAFGREFQEDILVWHIATEIFLICGSDDHLVIHDKNADTHAKAIKAMSDYLMFLMAVRRYMVPGLTLRSLYEVTLKSLQEIWIKSDEDICSSWTTGQQKLAWILLKKKKKDLESDSGVENSRTRLVSDGVNIAVVLLEADCSEMPMLLELVFNIWVDKLLYAATRCSRKSHARQLGRGGELTTILWIMAEHAGPFQIGEDGPDEKEEFGETEDSASDIIEPVEQVEDPQQPDGLPEETPQPHPPPWWPPQTLPPMWSQPPWCPPQAMLPPSHMWPQPPWDPMYMPEFGGFGLMPPPQEAPAAPPPHGPAPKAKGLPPQMPPSASAKREDAKPKRRRRRVGRYATLYPVD